MKTTGDETTPLSATQAGKIVRRVKPVKKEAQRVYTVRNKESPTGQTIGTFSVIKALCPKIKPNTLKRRLDSHERDLDKLRESPANGRRRGRPRTAR